MDMFYCQRLQEREFILAKVPITIVIYSTQSVGRVYPDSPLSCSGVVSTPYARYRERQGAGSVETFGIFKNVRWLVASCQQRPSASFETTVRVAPFVISRAIV